MGETIWLFCLLLIFSFSVEKGSAIWYGDVQTLYSTLTENYTRAIRPELDLNNPTVINVSFYIISLKDIDDVRGAVTISGFFDMEWHDFNLMWPFNFIGIHDLEISDTVVWTPQLVNGHSVKDFKIVSVDNLKVNVKHYGQVTYFPGDRFTFSCDIDSTAFPFDTQTCSMDLFSLSYQSSALRFVPGVVFTNLYTENSQWEYSEAKIVSKNYGTSILPGFKIDFTFKRRSTFPVLSLLIPIDFLGFLNICVFFLPQESGERVGFAISAVLAVVIFITVAQEHLSSTATPTLASLYGVLIQDMALSGCIVVSVIFGSWLYHREDRPVPNWLSKLVSVKPSAVLKSCLQKMRHGCDKCTHKIKNDSNTTIVEPFEKRKEVVTWKRVSSFWDFVCFCFYIIWFIEGNFKFIIDTQVV